MQGFRSSRDSPVVRTPCGCARHPRMETFLGYPHSRANSNTNVPAFSANGGSGQFVYDFGKHQGAVADLGAVHNGNIGGAQIDNTTISCRFDPPFTLGYSPVRPYVQVLF